YREVWRRPGRRRQPGGGDERGAGRHRGDLRAVSDSDRLHRSHPARSRRDAPRLRVLWLEFSFKGSFVVDARTLRRVRISGLATYVPPRTLTNADLERMVETSDEWILQRTGIRQRHIVDPGVATSDLAKEAALGAIAQAGLTPHDIDFIVVGT